MNCEARNIQTNKMNTYKPDVKSSKFHRARCHSVCKSDTSITSGKTNSYTWTGTYTTSINKFTTNKLTIINM